MRMTLLLCAFLMAAVNPSAAQVNFGPQLTVPGPIELPPDGPNAEAAQPKNRAQAACSSQCGSGWAAHCAANHTCYRYMEDAKRECPGYAAPVCQ